LPVGHIRRKAQASGDTSQPVICRSCGGGCRRVCHFTFLNTNTTSLTGGSSMARTLRVESLIETTLVRSTLPTSLGLVLSLVVVTISPFSTFHVPDPLTLNLTCSDSPWLENVWSLL